MRNRGWGLSIKYHTSGRKFSHSISFNISDTHNVVTKFVGGQQIVDIGQAVSRIVKVGLPFNSYYGYKVIGFYQNEQQIKNLPRPIATTPKLGDVIYKDKNGDGTITPDDRYVFGNAFPRYTFGLNYGLKWRNFNLNLVIQGVGKRTMNIRGGNVTPFQGNYVYTMYTNQLDYWSPTNPHAKWPRLAAPGSASDHYNWDRVSNLYYFNGAYVRLKT